ncbi:MAG TPA: hypothetical protein VF019_00855 [Nitrospira sp.]
MNQTTDRATGFFVPTPVTLEAVLARLDLLSRQPEFALQREIGLARTLKPYLGEGGESCGLPALPQESELANLALFCDFYPEDGQLTLIEQLRDVITEHIPEDERAWLDPLKHSYMDLLELTTTPTLGTSLTFRSIGDGTTFVLPNEEFAKDLSRGQILLTRVIRDPNRAGFNEAVWAGCGLILSSSEGKALYDRTREWERRMEMSSGELVLGEWQEFTKRFGHILLWIFAEMRVAALADAVAHIQYRTPNGEPYLYAIALYDHHEYGNFAEGLSNLKEWRADSEDHNIVRSTAKPLAWIQTSDAPTKSQIIARLTLTSSQLIVECDSRTRLDEIKHRLAAVFGFSLHFRGETMTPPYHDVTLDELRSDQPLTVVISHEDDRTMLQAFLEKAYLEWSDQPHGMLKGQTPRHASRLSETRDVVSRLITEMEASDLGVRRDEYQAYDYNILRGHVGLDETK